MKFRVAVANISDVFEDIIGATRATMSLSVHMFFTWGRGCG